MCHGRTDAQTERRTYEQTDGQSDTEQLKQERIKRLFLDEHFRYNVGFPHFYFLQRPSLQLQQKEVSLLLKSVP